MNYLINIVAYSRVRSFLKEKSNRTLIVIISAFAMKYARSIVAILVIAVLMISVQVNITGADEDPCMHFGKRWEIIEKGPGYCSAYDKQTMIRTPEKHVRVWTKEYITRDFCEKAFEGIEENSTANLLKKECIKTSVGITTALYEIDCKSGQYLTLEESRTVKPEGSSSSDKQWHYPSPETQLEILLNSTCK